MGSLIISSLYAITAEYYGERILKIGQYFAEVIGNNLVSCFFFTHGVVLAIIATVHSESGKFITLWQSGFLGMPCTETVENWIIFTDSIRNKGSRAFDETQSTFKVLTRRHSGLRKCDV